MDADRGVRGDVLGSEFWVLSAEFSERRTSDFEPSRASPMAAYRRLVLLRDSVTLGPQGAEKVCRPPRRVCLVYLVCPVCLVCLVERNSPDRPDEPDQLQ